MLKQQEVQSGPICSVFGHGADLIVLHQPLRNLALAAVLGLLPRGAASGAGSDAGMGLQAAAARNATVAAATVAKRMTPPW